MPAHLYDVHSVCCLLPAFTHTWGCSRNGSICMDRYNFMSFKNASQALCSNGQTDSGNVTNENHVHAVPQPSRLRPRHMRLNLNPNPPLCMQVLMLAVLLLSFGTNVDPFEEAHSVCRSGLHDCWCTPGTIMWIQRVHVNFLIRAMLT